MRFQPTAPQRAALAIILIGMAVAALAWLCAYDPQIAFLPGVGRAEWILFPSAPDPASHPIAELDALFRREFILAGQPRTARLSVRAAKRVQLMINGNPVALGLSRNWKDISDVDVAASLRAGTNTIEARVFNDNGPPALWLALRTDSFTLQSDASWETSFAGSAWRRAALATTPRRPGRGNPLAGSEKTLAALAVVWPMWMLLGGFAMVIWWGGRWWLGRARAPNAVAGLSQREMAVLLTVIAALWLALFCNNTRLLPLSVGFDARPHVNYIEYLQKHKALPLPNEGWEMFQPPLYYIISAVTLSSFGLSVADAAAGTVLRLLTMSFGLAHVVFVFLSLRLLFPKQLGQQLAGLTLAAFLPMNLYLSHYVTNETLAALLVSGSVYFCLRILKTGANSWASFSLLGLVLGAAVLTKFTAVLAVPFILIALAQQTLARRGPALAGLKKIGGMLGLAILVSGWHYIRLWRQMGSVVIGGWDPASGSAWWQEDGYHAAAYFGRFGESLVQPLFSCTASFLDGIYSTLWGDGLCGGALTLAFRPPWNYNLMCGGYLLAILPTILILTGAAVSSVKLVREGGSDRLVLMGLAFLVWVGLVCLNLKVPYYASTKAFYGLCALVPLCFFCADGWNVLTRGRKPLQFLAGTFLLVWALNSFASVWIRNGSAPTHIFLGQKLAGGNSMDAAAMEYAKAVTLNPADAPAWRLLASALNESGETDRALQAAGRAVELDPKCAANHYALSAILAKQGQIPQAIGEVQRAVELGPEDLSAQRFWAKLLIIRQGRGDEAIRVARNGLAVFPYDPGLHYVLGVALARKGNFMMTTNQFAYALRLRPDWMEAHLNCGQALLHLGDAPNALRQFQAAVRAAPDSPLALDGLAWFLATYSDAALRNGPEAARLAEQACGLTDRRNPKLLDTLAAAYAEAGKFPEAINVAQEAIAVARADGDAAAARQAENLLGFLQSGRPYHENPLSSP